MSPPLNHQRVVLLLRPMTATGGSGLFIMWRATLLSRRVSAECALAVLSFKHLRVARAAFLICRSVERLRASFDIGALGEALRWLCAVWLHLMAHVAHD